MERLGIVMAMGEGENGRWTCAAVARGDDGEGKGYELLIAKQVVLNKAALTDEIGLVYDRGSRLYIERAAVDMA